MGGIVNEHGYAVRKACDKSYTSDICHKAVDIGIFRFKQRSFWGIAFSYNCNICRVSLGGCCYFFKIKAGGIAEYLKVFSVIFFCIPFAVSKVHEAAEACTHAAEARRVCHVYFREAFKYFMREPDNFSVLLYQGSLKPFSFKFNIQAYSP